MRRIKVLVVDDSAFMRKIISDALEKNNQLVVVGVARHGEDAIEQVRRLRPDVVTMDVEMPVMNGLEALRTIMRDFPTPVVMLSSPSHKAQMYTMQAMAAGAVDFVVKPSGPISLNLVEFEQQVQEKVLEASKVRVKPALKKRSNYIERKEESSRFSQKEWKKTKNFSKKSKTFVIIGTSTGGPRALQEVITKLPSHIGVPILIVQHMPRGFTKSLAERLDEQSNIRVKEAEQGEPIENNTAYIAPGGQHLKFRRVQDQYVVHLDRQEPPRKAHRPAVDVLLESCCAHPELDYVTVIMTGMGYDGREGMKKLRKVDTNVVTIAESEESAVIYGMPRAIIENDLADHVEDLSNISNVLIDILKS